MLDKIFVLFSFFIVAFGQPAWSSFLACASYFGGFAFFWIGTWSIKNKKKRFWLAVLWFMAVQLIQLSWLLSHPYLYIYLLYFLFSFLLGLQFGLTTLFITEKTLTSFLGILGIASFWTLMEWERLFVFSGFTWNPIGLSLSAFDYSLQFASLWGIFGLSFWTFFVNLLALKVWVERKTVKNVGLWILIGGLPFFYGFIQYHTHEKNVEKALKEPGTTLSVVLVQTAFPIEEALEFRSADEAIEFVMKEWKQILCILKKEQGKSIDLIALPEYVVPYGTYFTVFPFKTVKETFTEVFGETSHSYFPSLEPPLAKSYQTAQETVYYVSNAFWVQTIANLFNAEIVIGLEDVEKTADNQRNCYSAAFHFRPQIFCPERYEKRVLIPMGEYIPFEFCKEIAKKYGIGGSFIPGKEAKIFKGKVPFGVSICYEETFANLMSETRAKGAELLVNLTSDVWYPNSKLPQQHLDHGRIRSVENGIPIVRACNTGITCALDSLGRIIKVLGETSKEQEWSSSALHVKVPLYSFNTFYGKFGDKFIVFSSLAFCFIAVFRRQKEPF